MNYDLVVTDCDGTLLTDKGDILPETKIAVENFIKNGGKFAICTGRMLKSIFLSQKV